MIDPKWAIDQFEAKDAELSALRARLAALQADYDALVSTTEPVRLSLKRDLERTERERDENSILLAASRDLCANGTNQRIALRDRAIVAEREVETLRAALVDVARLVRDRAFPHDAIADVIDRAFETQAIGEESSLRDVANRWLVLRGISSEFAVALAALLNQQQHSTEERVIREIGEWSSANDQPLPEDAEIKAVFPTRSGRHDLYAEAMRLVGARQTKYGLVDLVNWLLHRAVKAEARAK